MPAHCAVVNCSDKYVHSGSISFHRFPFKRKDLLQQWKDFTQRSGQWMPSKWSAICSRHFVDDDFNCSNNRKTLKKNAVPTVGVAASEGVMVQQVQVQAEAAATAMATATATATAGKSMCRFCGTSAPNCVSFDKSFELFGMIQKCFPTLQILQDDTLPLPKDICGDCCRQLERFSQFCDVVMLAQSELQRKYRRQLKIKQEPVVRVKQEACESLDNLFPDELDMGLDDACCDHEADANDETEQKFQFCDFPMLNAQDIINNCDIMEIINLDDPFINITDDADVAQAQQPVPAAAVAAAAAPVMPTASVMLQTELLTEEHNYAKEDWQLPALQQYKTEKVECAEGSLPAEQQQQQQQAAAPPPPPQATEPRSSKPIVTNVSQIPPPGSKPNIVVLNDSVVQSSAFRLHNCSLCTTKFFTAESLHQHYVHTHGTPTTTPMPTPLPALPMVNISLTGGCGSALKLESSSGSSSLATAAPTSYWQPDWLPPQLPAKKKIDILDMQRSFLHHNDLIAAAQQQQPQTVSPLSPPAAAAPQQSANYAYAKLAARYRRLQHKCRRQLRTVKSERRHRCPQCRRCFASVLQLLVHRRRRRHFVLPPRSAFAVKCFGCLRLFRTRLALRQHMRYICQSLPLRNARLQSYRCRHCQLISFTHWRIYRRHELKCRPRRRAQRGVARRRRATLTTSTTTAAAEQPQTAAKRNGNGNGSSHSCSVCQKSFSSRTGLKQHRITHSSERRHKCSICDRVFKRRNGLSQHVKGFHLQLKPHQCPVCQHRYALKCDMLRCRHSQRRGVAVNV
ncbi:hypothetical protein KR222_005049, partial [Zaprionus bogoriensis]